MKLTVYSSDDRFCHKQVSSTLDRYQTSAIDPFKPSSSKVHVKVVLARDLHKKYNPDDDHDKSDNDGDEKEEIEANDKCLPNFLMPDPPAPVTETPKQSRLFEIERPKPAI